MNAWTTMDVWIVVTGALCAMACALPGCFLVLRRMSMMGDAISHAVLPGLAIAFLATGQRASLPMFLGAVAAGLLTALFTQWIHRSARVDEGAAMGVVFTTLFAIGLLIIVKAADHVDLDPGCVLYGAIELTPLDTVKRSGIELPRAAWINGGVLMLNILIILALFKELRLACFDPGLAATLGFSPGLLHYLLMSMVAVTTVAAFESVGSIIVIAMLTVPAATAQLLTKRLLPMLLVSAGLAATAAVTGHAFATWLPSLAGLPPTSTAGSMAFASGLLFIIAVMARHLLASRAIGISAMSPPKETGCSR
jgi:manganese/zinc/iron transport system permease protein